jgi:hypothetical protein
VAAALASDYRAVPWLHAAMLCAAVFFMDFALRRFGATPWQACAFSSGFLYATLQQPWTFAAVLTDFPACVTAGIAVASLFWVVSERKSAAAWLVLSAATAASYHLRPAMLFLVPLVPLLGGILLRIRAAQNGEATAWKLVLPALLGAALVPLLAYCLLRMLVVNDFGLVAMGGDTSSGLAAEMLDWKTIDRDVPEQYRPLAEAILRERERMGLRSAFGGGMAISMRRYEDQFSVNIYDITIPAAKTIFGTDPVALNHELRKYSRAVLWNNKDRYLLWSIYMLPRTLSKIVYRGWFLWLSLPLFAVLTTVRRRKFRGATAATALRFPPILTSTCWLTAMFYLGAVSVLITAASYADSRLVMPSALFLPSLMLLLILRELELIGPLPRFSRDGRRAQF